MNRATPYTVPLYCLPLFNVMDTQYPLIIRIVSLFSMEYMIAFPPYPFPYRILH